MESVLFSGFDPHDKDNERFVTDLRQLISLSDSQLDAVLSAMPNLARVKVKAEEKEVLKRLEIETQLKLVEIGHVVDVLRFFISSMLADVTGDDAPEAWAADLEALEVLDADQARLFAKLFKRLKTECLPELDAIQKERSFGTGIFPSLKGAGTTVELRGIFDKPFSWGTSVEDYAPQLRDLVAVVSVHLMMDAGSPDEIWFQATPDEIELLIGELEAARKQADVLKNRVTLSHD